MPDKAARAAAFVTHAFAALERRDFRTDRPLRRSLTSLLEELPYVLMGSRPPLADRTLRIARFTAQALREILRRPHSQLTRRRALVAPHRARDLDVGSIRWLARQAGRSVHERIATARRVPSIERVVDFDLLENRVAARFARDLAEAIERILTSLGEDRDGGDDDDAGINDAGGDERGEERRQILVDALRCCTVELARSPLADVALEASPTLNNALRSDPDYARIWAGWTCLSEADDALARGRERLFERTAELLMWTFAAMLRELCGGLWLERYVDAIGDDGDGEAFGLTHGAGSEPGDRNGDSDVEIYLPDYGERGFLIALCRVPEGFSIRRSASSGDDDVDTFRVSVTASLVPVPGSVASDSVELDAIPSQSTVSNFEAPAGLAPGSVASHSAGFRARIILEGPDATQPLLAEIDGEGLMLAAARLCDLVAGEQLGFREDPPGPLDENDWAVGWDIGASSVRVHWDASGPRPPRAEPVSVVVRSGENGRERVVARRGALYDVSSEAAPIPLSVIFDEAAPWEHVEIAAEKIVAALDAEQNVTGRALAVAIPDVLGEIAESRLHRSFGARALFARRSACAAIGYCESHADFEFWADDLVVVIDGEAPAVSAVRLRSRNETDVDGARQPVWERRLDEPVVTAPPGLSYERLVRHTFATALFARAVGVPASGREALLDGLVAAGVARRWFEGERAVVNCEGRAGATRTWLTIPCDDAAVREAKAVWSDAFEAWVASWPEPASAPDVAGQPVRVLLAGHPFGDATVAERARAALARRFARPGRPVTFWEAGEPASLVALGACIIASRQGRFTYCDVVSALYLETPQYVEGVVLFPEQRLRPGERVEYSVLETALPAGTPYVVFPLLRRGDRGDKSLSSYDAYVTHPSFPLPAPLPVRLDIDYMYGTDGFRVVVRPLAGVRAPFRELEVRWLRSDEQMTLEAGAAPHVVAPERDVVPGNFPEALARFRDALYALLNAERPEDRYGPMARALAALWQGAATAGTRAALVPGFEEALDELVAGLGDPRARTLALTALGWLGPDAPDAALKALHQMLLVPDARKDALKMPSLARALGDGRGPRRPLVAEIAGELRSRVRRAVRRYDAANAGTASQVLAPIKTLAKAAWWHPDFVSSLVENVADLRAGVEKALELVEWESDRARLGNDQETAAKTLNALRSTLTQTCLLVSALLRERESPALADWLGFGTLSARVLARELRLANHRIEREREQFQLPSDERGGALVADTSAYLTGYDVKAGLLIDVAMGDLDD